MSKEYGRNLEFINRIKRDGNGVETDTDYSHLDNEQFTLHCLSITKGTWIACSMSCYVVKLKNKTNE